MVLVATQVKRRRGTTAENDAFTGAEGEIVVDTERHELRVHDGVTQGGHIIPTNETLDFANKALDNLSQEGEARFTNKADSDLSNTPSNIDYVIESQLPTAGNGYTWYRKYKSGWVEQGGVLSQTGGILSVSFPVEMADTNYTLIRVQNQTNDTQSYYPGWTSGTESRTTTGFTYNGIATSVWQVSGYAA